MAKGQVASTVILNYVDLVNGSVLSEDIATAFGGDGQGILFVRGVPGYVDARLKLLPLASKFSKLDRAVQEKYVHHDSCYSFGWSHGKEKLQGRPDVSKGSYYANPQYDRPIDDEGIIAQYPSFVHPNIWPTDDLPELEDAFKVLGQMIVSAAILVAKQCDKYVHSLCPTYENDKLQSIIIESRCCKARLLHYYSNESLSKSIDIKDKENEPIDNLNLNMSSSIYEPKNSPFTADDEFSSWCGWHNDHGSLTGLTSALLLNEKGEITDESDPSSGLYIRNRKSELIRVIIPFDCLAFQIGETAQIHSGGILQATPHAVKASNLPSMKGITRETFAVFMEPMFDYPMLAPEGVDPRSAQSSSAAQNLPPGVPSISSRWSPNENFGEFTKRCLESYH